MSYGWSRDKLQDIKDPNRQGNMAYHLALFLINMIFWDMIGMNDLYRFRGGDFFLIDQKLLIIHAHLITFNCTYLGN